MKFLSVISLYAATSLVASATVVLNYDIERLRYADGTTLAGGGGGAGTLYALVVDAGTAGFAGFSAGGSIAQTPGTVNDFFSTGQQFSVGDTLGGGTIFHVGGMASATGAAIGSYSGTLTQGQNWVIYWFPGSIYTGALNEAQTISGNQVGGLNSLNTESGTITPMTVPADGFTYSTGAFSASAGGTSPNAQFNAVTLIPEPTSSLLSMLGGLALLFRRRRSA